MMIATTALALLPLLQTSEQGGVELAGVLQITSLFGTDDQFEAVEAHAGVVYAAGQAFSSWGTYWQVRAKQVADGSEVWSTQFAFDTGLNDATARDLVLSPDGSTLFVGGHLASSDPLDVDATVVAFDALDGSVKWIRQIDGAGLDDDVVALAVSPDGQSVVLCGTTDTGDGATGEQVLVALLAASDGALQWQWRYDGDPAADSLDRGVDVVFDPGGTRLFATGYVSPPAAGLVYGTFALQASDGAVIWSHHYVEPTPTNSAPCELATNGAQVVVAGRHLLSSPATYLDGTLALDAASGQMLWTASGAATSPTNASRAVTTDGSDFFLVESSPNDFFNARWVVSRVDGATGNRLWEDTYSLPGFPIAGLDPTAMAWDSDTDLLVVAGSRDLNQLSVVEDTDALVSCYDATTGARLWVEAWEGAGAVNDFFEGVTLDAGRAVAAGRSFVPTQGNDMTLMARDAVTGQLDWEQVEAGQGPASNAPFATVVDPASGDLLALGIVHGGAKSVAHATRLDDSSGAALWAYFDDPGTISQGRLVDGQVSLDGSTLYACGGTGNDLLVVALDSVSGALLWRRAVDGPKGFFDQAADLELSSDGSTLYVGGVANGPMGIFNPNQERAFFVLALDAATGADLWTQVHDPSDQHEELAGLALSPDQSTVFAVGTRDTTPSSLVNDDVEVVAYDAASGTLLWSATHTLEDTIGGVWGDVPVAARVSADGTELAIVGSAANGSVPDRAVLWRVDTSNGALVAIETIQTGGTSFEAVDAAFTADGASAIVIGDGDTALGGMAAAFDAALGQALWTRTYPDGFGVTFGALALSPDGTTGFVSGGDEDEQLRSMGIDLASGDELWRAVFAPSGDLDAISADKARTASYDDVRRRFWCGGGGPLTGADVDGLLLRYDAPTLLGDAAVLSLSTGGTQLLVARAGPSFAGDVYLLLGSLSGTTPGLPLGVGVLPLNVDSYTQLTLTEPGSAFLPGSLGLLDASGGAALALVVPPGTNPAVAGLTAHHAYVAIDLGPPGLAVVLTSNAIEAALVP